MQNISNLLDPKCIKLDLEAKKKKDAVVELCNLLNAADKIEEPRRAAKEILQREKLASTGIGEGIAIPHVLSDWISETILALGRKREGINFEAIDKRPVSLVFLILGPKGNQAEHLKLLSKLARLLRREELRQALIDAESNEDIIQVIQDYENS